MAKGSDEMPKDSVFDIDTKSGALDRKRPGTYRKDEVGWRNVIFLPFNFVWRVVLSIQSILYFNLILYQQVFMKVPPSHKSVQIQSRVLIIMTFFYLVDIVLTTLHKTWESVQKSKPYKPKSFNVILIDFLSILPFHFLFGKTFLSKDGYVNWVQIINMNGCMRIYRVFSELMDLQQRMDTNPILVRVIQQNILMLSVVSVCCNIWYIIGYTYYNKPASWLNEIKVGTSVNISNPNDMLIFSYTYIYAKLTHEVVTDVRPIHLSEVLFISLIKFLGYVLVIIMISNATTTFMKCQKHIFKVKSCIDINLKCLKGEKHKETKEYYSLFWKNWSCIQTCPILHKFPLCLQKDVLTDVYWDAITHSHVLRKFPPNIQRQFSLVMESKFLQPGDYIYKKGEMKKSYYYIAKGVVQIMSHYDGISPIMTISGGSCLGEISLLLPVYSSTDVICTSICEVRYLTFKKFYDVLTIFPNSSVTLRNIGVDHIGLAKKMHAIVKNYKEEDYVSSLYGVPQEDNLKWVKQRWRRVYDIEMGITKKVTEKIIRKYESEGLLSMDKTHSSKHLDLLVLGDADSTSWQADKCCIKRTCSYVLDPDCHFVKVWLVFIFTVITIDCFIVPYRAAFMIETTERQVAWDHIVFFAYILDIYIQAISGVRSVEITIMEPVRLLRHHLKRLQFLTDIVATIPLREILRLMYEERLISPNWALNRLLKLVRALTYFKYRRGMITANVLKTLIVEYIYIYVFVTFLGACFLFLNSCQFKVSENGLVCRKLTWFYMDYYNDIDYPKIVDEESRLKLAEDLAKSFFIALRNVFRYLLKSGLKANPPTSMTDIYMFTFCILLANNLFILTVSELSGMWILTRERKLAYEELLRTLKTVLSDKHVPVGLLNMLNSFINLQWKVNEAIEVNLEDTTTSELMSPILDSETEKIIIRYMSDIPFFYNLDENNRSLICKEFKIFTVPENFIFCRSGHLPSSFNIIINGYCKQTSMLKEDLFANRKGKLIGPSDSFPLMEVLQNKPCLQTTIGVTICEVASIDVIELRSILNMDVEVAAQIVHATDFEIKDVDIVVSKVKYQKKDKTQIKSFVSCRRNKQNWKRAYNLRKFLWKYVLIFWNPPYMIHPNGIFMLVWEMLKVTQVIISIMYTSLMNLTKCHGDVFTSYIPNALDTFSLVDVVLRMYIGYHNEQGVLINKRVYYFSHSFTVDFLSSLPVHIILEEYNFTIRFFLTLIMKTLQIYRISGLMFALQRRCGIESFPIFLINFIIHLMLIVTISGNCIFGYTCSVNCNLGGNPVVVCNNQSWISSNKLLLQSYEYQHPFYLIFFSIYMVVTIFLGNDQKAFHVLEHEVYFMVVFGAFAVIVKLYYLSKAISLLVGQQSTFSKYRDNDRLYWLFVVNEGGTKELASTVANHLAFEFSKLGGIKMIKLISALHPSLQSDLTFAIYYQSMLCLHQFVGNQKSIMRHLTKKVDEIHYRKNTVVINFSQVNDTIFFIQEGCISVFDEESEKCVKLLSPGSMFGSFKFNGKTRHVKKFISSVHTSLLHIKSHQFFVILRDYGKIYEEKFLEKTKGKEFVRHKSIKSSKVNIKSSQFLEDPKYSWLNSNLLWYRWLMFFLSMIIPYMTIFPVMYIFASEIIYPSLLFFIYCMDILSSLRIILPLFTKQTDEKTGDIISDLTKIRINYLKTPSEFILDLISNIPIEVLYYLVKKKWETALFLNRMLRLIIMIQYIKDHRFKIYVKPWLRWCEFIAYVTLLPYLFTCLWEYIVCKHYCHYIYNPLRNSSDSRLPAEEMHEKFIMVSFFEVMSMFTLSTSYHLGKPSNFIECVVMITVSLSSFLLLPLMIGVFCQTTLLNYGRKKVFEYSIQCMRIFLQLRDLSDSLLESLWNYALLLYDSDRGELIPYYLDIAPYNMKCELLYDLFGAHLKYNILFDGCRKNFVIQLSGCLKRSIYFPGDFIIRKYDVDNRIYFINSGEVDSVEYGELNEEIVQEVLITGDCFGLEQGLYERTAHLSTFKARSMVEMLTLQRDDWRDLIMAFPEEGKKIYRAADKIDFDALFAH